MHRHRLRGNRSLEGDFLGLYDVDVLSRTDRTRDGDIAHRGERMSPACATKVPPAVIARTFT